MQHHHPFSFSKYFLSHPLKMTYALFVHVQTLAAAIDINAIPPPRYNPIWL
jgi:hypothetical protein